MRKYAGYGAFKRYGYVDFESASFPSFLQSESLHVNHWRQPLDPLWSSDDGQEIRRFYEEHVAINKRSWQKNCEYVDRLLSYIFDEIQDQSRMYKYLQLHHFVRQGSSREGLKISAADEFDVVLPFTFMGMKTDVEKLPDADLPAGVAEICVPSYSSFDEIKPAGLITHKNGKRYVDTHVLHEKLFKSLVDKTLQQIRADSVCLGYKINRKSGPTAIALEMTVSEPGQDVSMSVDIVPGFDFAGTSTKHRKFLVTRWIPEARNATFATPYPRPNTVWRISHSHYEMDVFETWCNNANAKRLVTAYRILKGIRVTDVNRDPSSQLASVAKSYHLKNILLFALLYLTKLNEKDINSVTEALSYLVAMFRICLERKSLPQFFTSNFGLWKCFPEENFHEEDLSMRVNLFGEMRDSVYQILRNFERSVGRFGLDKHVYQDFLQLFEDHVCIN